MKPGWMELTRTPLVAQCSATFLVSVRTAPLAAWYAGEVAEAAAGAEDRADVDD